MTTPLTTCPDISLLAGQALIVTEPSGSWTRIVFLSTKWLNEESNGEPDGFRHPGRTARPSMSSR
ncbi:hypothetical protein F1D05_24320 [Kribbella qitaiheensis]|uniref:Uncharacterized protein n=1 Tax=Kribbella qitaiheensis TaxID=1544730 RepID=A0A7G6X2J9_9ACTN|nr:hypothetical protein [Kribbella qitaiheensis]QNE20464.1 hypothetical protein F1D05_24320 [Kribbella qitaiheensis]